RQLISCISEKFQDCNADVMPRFIRPIRHSGGTGLEHSELLAHEFAAIIFFESKSDFDFPSEASQAICCNQSVTRVVAFSGKHNALARPREKLRDCLCNTGASVVHERFNLHSAGESGLFCCSHLRRRQNRQVQIRPPDLLRRSVLLSRLISMRFSFYARFSCVNSWTCGVWNSSPSSGPCTVAAGLFHSLPPASWTAHLQRNCARGPQLQFPLRVSGGKKQFARTQPRLDSLGSRIPRALPEYLFSVKRSNPG